MWKGRRWKSPEPRYESGRPGCMWGVLHRLHRRPRSRKMLLDQELVFSGLKHQKMGKHITPIVEEHEFLDAKENSLVDVNSSIGMLSDSTYTEELEMQMKQRQNLSVLPVPARMMRTISIHHLECDEYVQLDRKVSNIGDDRVILCSYDVGPSGITSEHMDFEVNRHTNDKNNDKHDPLEEFSSLLFEQQEPFQETLYETKVALLKHQNADFTDLKGKFSMDEAKIFMDAMELFHGNREEILLDPNYLWDLKCFGANELQNRSVSCPGGGFSGGRTGTSSNRRKDTGSFVNQDDKLQSEIFSSISETDATAEDEENLLRMKKGNVDVAEPHNITHETRKPGTSHHLKDIKRRIKDLIKDEKKGADRITLDGILDKIPAGQAVAENWSIVERYGQKSHFGSVSSAGNFHFRRSRSLSDSVDGYSHLLEPNLSRESHEHDCERLKLLHKDGASLSRWNASKTLGRIYSLPEYESYYTVKLDLDYNNSRAISPLRITSLNHDLASSATTFCASNVKNPTETPIISQNEDVIRVADTKNLVFVAENSIHNAVLDSMQCTTMGDVSNEIYNELDSMSEEETRDNPYELEIGSGMEHIGRSVVIKPSSAPKTLSDEDLMNIVMIPLPEEHVQNKDSRGSLTAIDVHDDKFVDTPSPTKFDLDSLRNGVQSKDIADFNYVMDILKRSGFMDSEPWERWHSPELPLDVSLFKELEGISPDIEICSCVVDLKLDHLLLFDLTNEVLLEIHRTNSVPQLWSSSFPSLIRWRHGLFFLKEVWANISWHLSCEPQLNSKTDDIVSRDFAGNAGWMDMRCGIERIGMVLAEMILDDVVDETVPELLNLTSRQCAVC